MKHQPRVQFALPGIIALLIFLAVRDLLPEWSRLYVTISIVVTLIMGLLTGEVAGLSSDRRRRSPGPPAGPCDGGRDYGLGSVVLAVLGIGTALALTVIAWPSEAQPRTLASLLAALVGAGLIAAPFELGALLVGLRTRQSKWGRAGLAIALATTGLLVLAWAGLMALYLLTIRSEPAP